MHCFFVVQIPPIHIDLDPVEGLDDDGRSTPSIWDGEATDVAMNDVGLNDVGLSAVSGAVSGDAWSRAEHAAWPQLLAATAALVRLDERLLGWPPGARRGAVARLALRQAADLAWASGTPVDPATLALDGVGRIGRAGDDDRVQARAAWSARRLAATSWRTRDLAPSRASRRDDHGASRRNERRDPCDGEDDAGPAWADAVRALPRLQPITVAAAADRLWATLDVGGGRPDGARAVAVMKLASRTGRGGAPFAPTPRRRRVAGPDPAARLAALAGDLADGAATALAHLDDLAAWRARAEAAIADLSGKTPPRLVEALTASVAITATQAARRCGVSKTAVTRSLAVLKDRGVAREISGQARFQVWVAAL